MVPSTNDVRCALCKLFVGWDHNYVSSATMANNSLGVLPTTGQLYDLVFLTAIVASVIVTVGRFLKWHLGNDSRSNALVGCYGAIVAAASVCVSTMTGIYGDLMMFLVSLSITIPMIYFLVIYTRSNIHMNVFTESGFNNFSLTTIIVTLVYIQFFPQQFFTQCDFLSLIAMPTLIVFFSCYATILFESAMCLYKILNAKKCLIFKDFQLVAYMVEKKGSWVEFAVHRQPKKERKMLLKA